MKKYNKKHETKNYKHHIKSVSLRLQTSVEHIEPTPGISVKEQNGSIPAPHPKKTPPVMTPEKNLPNLQVVSQQLQQYSPNRFLQIFSQKLQEAYNNPTALGVAASATARKVVPRFRQSTYGEVLTTFEGT